MADTALAIPGLFLTCIEYFKLARLSREFKDDFGSSLLQLRISEIRLHRWGRAAGITDADSATFVQQLQSSYPPEEIDLAYNACWQISKQLRRAKEDSEEMISPNRRRAVEDLENETVDELQRLKICGTEVSRTSRVLHSVKSGYERSLRFTERVAVRGKWALYKKDELTALLAGIDQHITKLETLFPQKEHDLAAEEATKMNRDDIKLLAAISMATDPIVEALRAEAPAKGFVWDQNEINGFATAHLGHNYAAIPENESGATWSRTKAGGNSNTHLGHNYGYAIVPPLNPNSAGDGKAPPPPTVAGAHMDYMDRDDFASGSGQTKLLN